MTQLYSITGTLHLRQSTTLQPLYGERSTLQYAVRD